MNYKFKPGPWEAREIDKDDNTWDAWEIMTEDGNYISTHVDGKYNARIISAAPDMIECLTKNYRDIIDINKILLARGYHPYNNMREEIKDIIEHATGMTIEEVLK